MIHVVGLGPGSKEYILPKVVDIIKKSEVVIGASRNLESIKEFNNNTIDLSMGLESLGEYLKINKDKNICVVVSGDTGFYSLLEFTKRYVPSDNIEVTPGISSLQYFYGRLKRNYIDSKWISLHGRECDLIGYLKDRVELGILTDKEQNNRYIARKMQNLGILDAKIYIGERLSYKDEKILCLTVSECLEYQADDLSVVVVSYE